MPGVRDKLSLFPIITALSIGVVAGYLLGSSQIPSDIYPTPASNYKSKPLEIDQRVKKLSGQNSDFIVEDTTPEPKGIKTSNSNNLIEPDLVTSPAEEVSFAQSLTADFIQLAANQLPQDVLLTYLDTATPFKKNEFQSMNDPVSFAGKVAQLATGQEFGFDAPLVSSDKTITNFLVGEEFQEGDNLSVIGPETTRIFSFFELPNYTRTDVLVKWYYSDTNEILSFKRFPINAESTRHYVWLDNQLGWVIGNYKVEVYSTDESLNLLSSGNYYVSE